MLQPRFQQWLDIPAQHGCAHDHRVAAGDQHARHLAVLPEVVDDPAQVRGGHLEPGLIHELGPPEAVRAVRVAGLALLGEDQDRLRVFVLHSGQRFIVEVGDVQRQLPGGVRVQPHPHIMRGRRDLLVGRATGQQPRDPGDVPGGQHVRLREHEAVDRVVGGHGPVDQFVDDVSVGPEGQYGPDGPDGQAFGLAEAGPGGQGVQVLRVVGTETSTPIRYWHYLPDATHGSPSGRSRSRRPRRDASPCGPRLAIFPPRSAQLPWPQLLTAQHPVSSTGRPPGHVGTNAPSEPIQGGHDEETLKPC